MKEIIKMTGFLIAVSFASGIGLSLTNYVTKPIIDEGKVNYYKIALKEVMPKALNFKRGNKKIKFIDQKEFIAEDESNMIIGRVCIVEEKGYGGKIKVIVGIDENKEVTGIKILEHKETPGIGSLAQSKKKMTGHDFLFLEQFKGKKLEDGWEVKKDVVTITGATITTRAITKAVIKALKLDK